MPMYCSWDSILHDPLDVYTQAQTARFHIKMDILCKRQHQLDLDNINHKIQFLKLQSVILELTLELDDFLPYNITYIDLDNTISTYDNCYNNLHASIQDLYTIQRTIHFDNKIHSYISLLSLSCIQSLIGYGNTISIIAFHLSRTSKSRKKPLTNWQNFSKQRKLASLPYKFNSSIWKSLPLDIKSKYNNPYYKHF